MPMSKPNIGVSQTSLGELEKELDEASLTEKASIYILVIGGANEKNSAKISMQFEYFVRWFQPFRL